MTQPAYTIEDRMKLLRKVNQSLDELIEFNHAHRGRWTPEEFAEYKKLHLAWSASVDALTNFERNIPDVV